MREPLGIVRVGAFCPIGLDAPQTASSMMAGYPRKHETSFYDREGEPIVMGHLPTEVLPPLVEGLESVPLTRLQQRILRLAGPALQEVLGVEAGEEEEGAVGSRALLKELGALPPLFVAGPQPPPKAPELVLGTMLQQIVRQAGVPIDVANSRLFPFGHAGMFFALKEAIERLLDPGLAEVVVVGGVDTYFDAERLMRLQRERRLLTSGLQDAASPGEGAAFVLLATRNACRRYGLQPLAWISAVGVGMEPGHRYSEAPLKGDGLAAAVTQAFRQRVGPNGSVRLLMAGLTGERIHAKEWGVAYVRNQECFADPLRVEHPAEYTGDAGAALAPLMLTITAQEVHSRGLPGPALVWASSDGPERGALLLEAN